MTRALAARLLAALFALWAPVPLSSQDHLPPAAERPKLVVLAVVDQLATWTYRQARPHFSDEGFRRVEREGTSFPECAFRHACTLTGPGHATISTGALPSSHGLIGNEWFDRAGERLVNCCEDPEAPLVGVESGDGRSAVQLRAPTLGDTMKAHFGARAKVVGIGGKDRAAILLSGPSADLAAWPSVTSGGFVSSRPFTSALPAWLAAINATQPFDRYFQKEWRRFGPESAYAGLVDERPFEYPGAGGSRTVPRVMGGLGDRPSKISRELLLVSPFLNEIVLEAAERAIDVYELGKDEVPDLLGIGFSASDYVGHACGPDSVEARDVILRMDALLARLLKTLDGAVGAGRYVLILTSDHGVALPPETVKAARLSGGRASLGLEAAKRANAALIAFAGAAPPPRERWIVRYDNDYLYLDVEGLAAKGISAEAAAGVAARAAARTPNIAQAVSTHALLAGQHPPGELYEILAAAVYPKRAGDVMLVPEPYWIDPLVVATHGTPYAYDREVPLFLLGPRIRAGHICEDDVSPAVGVAVAARLLGIPKPAMALEGVPAGILEPAGR